MSIDFYKFGGTTIYQVKDGHHRILAEFKNFNRARDFVYKMETKHSNPVNELEERIKRLRTADDKIYKELLYTL